MVGKYSVGTTLFLDAVDPNKTGLATGRDAGVGFVGVYGGPPPVHSEQGHISRSTRSIQAALRIMQQTICPFAQNPAAKPIISGRERGFPVSLLRRFEKIYVFTFYVQYRCATSFGNQAWGEGNAVFGMALLEYFLLLELICGIALLTGRTPIAFPKLGVALGYTLVLLLAYFALVRKHQWLRYKSEFEQYSRGKHFLASLGVGILMAAALLGIGVIKAAIGSVRS